MTSCRLAGAAQDQIDRIILESARNWGVEAAARYHGLMLSAFAALGASPALFGSRDLATVPGVRVFPLRLGRRLVEQDQRVGQPRHIVVYRIAPDGVGCLALPMIACFCPGPLAECGVRPKAEALADTRPQPTPMGSSRYRRWASSVSAPDRLCHWSNHTTSPRGMRGSHPAVSSSGFWKKCET